MSTTFPRVRRSSLGYDIDQVEDFLEDARRAYTGGPAEAAVVTAESIRRMAFAMRKGGYSPGHVDPALERLENAFATRERDRALAEIGDQAWYARARATAQEVLDRIVQPRGRRFRRVRWPAGGYSVRDVDTFTDRITRFLREGAALDPADVGAAVFRPQRGGYQEAQVDILLDDVSHVILAVRPSEKAL